MIRCSGKPGRSPGTGSFRWWSVTHSRHSLTAYRPAARQPSALHSQKFGANGEAALGAAQQSGSSHPPRPAIMQEAEDTRTRKMGEGSSGTSHTVSALSAKSLRGSK